MDWRDVDLEVLEMITPLDLGGLEMCLLPRRVLQAGNTTSFSWPWYLPFLSW